MDPWSLPGPAHFLRQATDALREGHNLIVAVPAYFLGGLCTALERHLHEEGWCTGGPILAGESDPVDQIFGALGLDDGSVSRRTVSLLRQRLEPGQAVLIRGVSHAVWPTWKRMLEEYEVASRGVSSFDRPLLVVVTEGVILSSLPSRAAALKVLPWQDVVGELDVLLYVTDKIRERGAQDYSTKLVARLISRLALWDLALADQLIEREPTELFRPAEILKDLSASADYSPGLRLNWESGGLQRFDGVELAHPFVALMVGEGEGELGMRIWAAQASEILPALELHRRALARRMRGLVPVPFRIGDEHISDLDDLEIGQLAYVAGVFRLSPAIRQTADKWRRLRNKLAHLEIIDSVDALDAELLTIGRVQSKR